MKRNKSVLIVLAVCVLSFALSCAHYPENQARPVYDPGGYRYPFPQETTEQDKIFVALAFSGGGTRAAAFSYGVLKGLDNIKLPNKPGKTLLDEVDLITSVSGGSFTAAYYGLYKKKIFEEYESAFLYRDIQGELASMLFNPSNWVRLLSPNFSRIDMAAELYDETVFGKNTYQALIKRGKHPFIAINATNLTTGSQFTFTQKRFDAIGSDLASFPVSRAVAASSAFPFLLSPVSLVNHPNPKGYELPLDVKNGLQDFGINDRRYFWAREIAEYQQNKKEHPFLHLMDGGLADNIGLRFIADEFARASGILAQRKSQMEHLVVIVVNAKTRPPEGLDKEESPPGITDVAYKTATVSMDNYSFETVQVTKDLLLESEKSRKTLEACQDVIDRHCAGGYELPSLGHSYDVHFVDLNFLKVKDPELRDRLLSLPTTFSLKPGEVKMLVQTGVRLIEESKELEELISSLQ